VVCQSISVVKPHEESADGSGRSSKREKPSRFRQSYDAHRKQTNHNHQPNWMARPKPRSVVAERNNLRGIRQVVRTRLNSSVVNAHHSRLHSIEGIHLKNVYGKNLARSGTARTLGRDGPSLRRRGYVVFQLFWLRLLAVALIVAIVEPVRGEEPTSDVLSGTRQRHSHEYIKSSYAFFLLVSRTAQASVTASTQ
jgi:hypothetical protein